MIVNKTIQTEKRDRLTSSSWYFEQKTQGNREKKLKEIQKMFFEVKKTSKGFFFFFIQILFKF